MFCPKCGKETAENHAFCASCGAPLAQPRARFSAGGGHLAQVQAGHQPASVLSWVLRRSPFLHREDRYSHSDACSRHRWHPAMLRLRRDSYCDRCFGLAAGRLHYCSYRQYEGQGRPSHREVVGAPRNGLPLHLAILRAGISVSWDTRPLGEPCVPPPPCQPAVTVAACYAPARV